MEPLSAWASRTGGAASAVANALGTAVASRPQNQLVADAAEPSRARIGPVDFGDWAGLCTALLSNNSLPTVVLRPA